jgi:hypothetical protein
MKTVSNKKKYWAIFWLTLAILYLSLNTVFLFIDGIPDENGKRFRVLIRFLLGGFWLYTGVSNYRKMKKEEKNSNSTEQVINDETEQVR